MINSDRRSNAMSNLEPLAHITVHLRWRHKQSSSLATCERSRCWRGLLWQQRFITNLSLWWSVRLVLFIFFNFFFFLSKKNLYNFFMLFPSKTAGVLEALRGLAFVPRSECLKWDGAPKKGARFFGGVFWWCQSFHLLQKYRWRRNVCCLFSAGSLEICGFSSSNYYKLQEKKQTNSHIQRSKCDSDTRLMVQIGCWWAKPSWLNLFTT